MRYKSQARMKRLNRLTPENQTTASTVVSLEKLDLSIG